MPSLDRRQIRHFLPLMPSSSLDKLASQVSSFLSGFDVPSLFVAAWAAENSPGDLVNDGLFKKHVDENGAVHFSAGSVDSCFVSGPSLSVGMNFFISGLPRSYQKPGKEVPVHLTKFLMKSFFPRVSCASAAAIPGLRKVMITALTFVG